MPSSAIPPLDGSLSGEVNAGEENVMVKLPSMVAALLVVLSAGVNAAEAPRGSLANALEPSVVRLVVGLQGSSGSTIGPDGALYVTEGAVGRVLRVDPKTGAMTPFASGFPPSIVGIGGAMDIAFLDNVAYVLVTLVGADVGGVSVVGIYRVDGPNHVTPIADIGAFSVANPPSTSFVVPTGVQYALQPFRGAFLVTDGHHNRVLRVTLDGVVSEFITFGNIVPTGLAVHGKTVYVAQAGPVPHEPQTGKVVSIDAKSIKVTEVASGARLNPSLSFPSVTLNGINSLERY